MVLLHICPLSDDICNGVNVVVPQHVIHQRKYADAALWNIGEPVEIAGLEQYFCSASLEDLPKPYCDPDLVIFHHVYIPRYLSLAKQLRQRGIPYVVVPHSSLNRAAQKKSRWKKLPANILYFKPFCDRAAGVQCLSRSEKEDCVFGNNLFVAPNGIDPQPVTKTEFNTDNTRFIYIGRLQTYIKGLDLMIKAFAAESDFLRKNKCRLDIYGPELDKGVCFADEIRQMIKGCDLDDIVALHPPVFAEEKLHVLTESDIFIQTSRSDGMPMGILEALSAGLPCVVTEGTTFAESIEKYKAGLNAGKTVQSIASALRQAVQRRDQLSELSKNALKYSQSFNWDSVAKTAVAAYSACLEKH